jgi:hypothetical protein
MKRAMWGVSLCLAALAWAPWSGPVGARGDDKKDDKGTVVELDGLHARAPAAWKEEEPSNRMRVAQFKLPKVKDDPRDAEVVIFNLGGAAKDNVERWKTFFIPPEGKSIDDVAKVTDMKVGDATVTYLDVQGTYKFKERPFDPNAKEEKLPHYRMLGVIFETGKKQYQIRCVGPAATVEHYKPGFDEWLKSFK